MTHTNYRRKTPARKQVEPEVFHQPRPWSAGLHSFQEQGKPALRDDEAKDRIRRCTEAQVRREVNQTLHYPAE